MEKSKQTTARLGFTIIDTLAVAGCLGTLLVLLIPTILQARQQAREIHCRQRLKVIGLAIFNYTSTYGTLPPGWVTGYRDGDSVSGYGWMSRILPNLDQAPLYNQLNFQSPLPPPDRYLSMALETFQCPEDSSESPQNEFRGGYGRSSYSGNLGDVAPLRWADGRMEMYWPGAAPTFSSVQLTNANAMQSTPITTLNYAATGLFSWNSKMGRRDIIDGASNTICVGERSAISGASIWAGVGSNRFENDAVTDVSFNSPLNKSLTGFSSAHQGGVPFLMMDGAVRFLSDNVESSWEGGVLQHLGNRNDKQVIPPNTFSNF